MIAKAMLNLDRVVHTLAPDFDPNAVIRDEAASMVTRKMTRSLESGSVLSRLIEVKEFVERLPNRVNKMLDAIGDLFMCGHNIIGAFTAYKSGHALNNKLLQAVLAKQEAWEYVTFQDDAELPLAFKAPSAVLA